MLRRALLVVLASATSTMAAPAGGQTGPWMAIELEVGETIQLGVGNAIGWFCDDPSLLAATIVTERGINYWVVEGARAGTTSCRVGTDPSRASYLIAITIKEGDSNRRQPR